MTLSERIPGMKPGAWLRNVVIGVGYVILILFVIGLAADPEDEDDDPEIEGGDSAPTETPVPDGGTATVTPEMDGDQPTVTPEPTPPPEPDSQRISGSGDDVTDPISIEGGFTTFDLTHSGERNFQVELVDAQTGDTQEYLANAIGEYDGTVGLYVPPGEYMLDITADRGWVANVEQPRFGPGDVEDPPVTASGEQADWLGPINFDGAVQVTVEGTGDGNLAVWLATVDGEQVDLLANDIAPYETTTVVGEDGDGLLLIEADQAGWRIEVEG